MSNEIGRSKKAHIFVPPCSWSRMENVTIGEQGTEEVKGRTEHVTLYYFRYRLARCSV